MKVQPYYETQIKADLCSLAHVAKLLGEDRPKRELKELKQMLTDIPAYIHRREETARAQYEAA